MGIFEMLLGGVAMEVGGMVVRKYFTGESDQGGTHLHNPAHLQPQADPHAWRLHVPLDPHIPPHMAEEVYTAMEEDPPEVLDAMSLNALRAQLPVAASHLAARANQLRQGMAAEITPPPSLRAMPRSADPEQDRLNQKHATLIARQMRLNELSPEERLAIAEEERKGNLRTVHAVLEEQIKGMAENDPNLRGLKAAAASALEAIGEKAKERIVNEQAEREELLGNLKATEAEMQARGTDTSEIADAIRDVEHLNGSGQAHAEAGE